MFATVKRLALVFFPSAYHRCQPAIMRPAPRRSFARRAGNGTACLDRTAASARYRQAPFKPTSSLRGRQFSAGTPEIFAITC